MIRETFLAVHDLTEADEPSQVLARLAAYHGALAVEAFGGRYGVPFDDEDPALVSTFLGSPERVVMDGHVAATRARLAWRFGEASLRAGLQARAKASTVVRAGSGAPPIDQDRLLRDVMSMEPGPERDLFEYLIVRY